MIFVDDNKAAVVLSRCIAGEPIASMHTGRCCAGAAQAANGAVFVVGGGASMYRNSPAFSTVERYDVDADAWFWGPEMTTARCALGVAYSLPTGHLFAAGTP